MNKMAQDLGVKLHLDDRETIEIKAAIISYSKMLLEENTKTVYNKAVNEEAILTKDITETTKSVGAYNEGLDFRLKSYDSLKRKIRSDYLETKLYNPNITLSDIAKQINDANRYTAILNVDNFVEQYRIINEALEEKGYKIIKSKNTFKLTNVTYKGINNVYESPKGVRFELQFHTKESFNVKDKINRKLYEEQRLPECTEERKKELEAMMIENTNKLTIPKDIDKI